MMKRRVLSVVLSAAMALSLAVPVMAEPAGTTTGKVMVDNVFGGVLIAAADGKVLPIGEEVELEAGTEVCLQEGHGIGYYVGDEYHK